MTTPSLSRRSALQAGAAATAAALLAPPGTATPVAAGRIRSEEHWARKGDVRLYLYRKLRAEAGKRPVLFLVHGSSFSGRGGFDLHVPGAPDYSMMDHFAERGFDVWTMDHEGYGRSTRTGRYSDVASGADDLAAGFRVVEQVTGSHAPDVYAQSGGALRAGTFAMREPDRVRRLILDGFTYTGENAPEIMRRRKALPELRAHPTRTADLQSFLTIFSRDDASTADMRVPRALAAYELALGNQVPNGTYLDMASKLPLVDPARLPMPVQILRAAADGNATDGELLDFFGKLPARDKQFAMIDGVSHVAVLGLERAQVFHVMEAFLTLPPRHDSATA
jgi:alpha-beta hydrolase superfamily lysophospholipase